MPHFLFNCRYSTWPELVRSQSRSHGLINDTHIKTSIIIIEVFMVLDYCVLWFTWKLVATPCRVRQLLFRIETVTLPLESDLDVAVVNLCAIFQTRYLHQCKEDIVSDKRCAHWVVVEVWNHYSTYRVYSRHYDVLDGAKSNNVGTWGGIQWYVSCHMLGWRSAPSTSSPCWIKPGTNINVNDFHLS